MAGDADDPVQQVPLPAREIVPDNLVAFLLARGTVIVPGQARRFHEVFIGVKVLAEIPFPPGEIVGKVVKIIAPLAKLDCGEHARPVHGFQHGGVCRA